jgi:nuclear pore complex protein Nup53
MTLGSPTAASPQSQTWGGGPPIHSLSLSSPPSHQNSLSLGISSPAYSTQPQQPPQQHPHLTQSGFLPNYLLGDNSLSSPVTTPGSLSHRQMISPTKLNRTLSNPSAPTTPLPRGPQLLKENSSINRSTRGTPGDKPSGPPTTSLLANLTPNTSNKSIINSSYMTPSRVNTSESVFPSVQDQAPDSPPNPLSTWVTVWGFPPSAASFVLQQISACGTVLQHVMPPNSNWMHVRFQTRLQASKAVGKNGSVIGNTIMLGVAPCKEESVVDQLNSSILDSSVGQQGGGQSVANISSSLNQTPRTIRPLTQAYKEVIAGTNTPNKSNGLVTKAMEYIFGW